MPPLSSASSGGGTLPLSTCHLTPYNLRVNQTNQLKPMQRLDVRCPSAPWENTTTDEDRAWDLCFSLSEDYGYACVYERVNGTIIGEYTDGRAT